MVCGKSKGRRFTYQPRWHPQCWIEQGQNAVDKIQVVEKRGKIGLPMMDEEKKKRFRILARRAAVIQRIRKEIEGGADVDKMVHLGGLLNKLKEEIGLLGGVPESWN